MTRIAFSSNDNKGLGAKISDHFGRCPYFTLVEVEDEKCEIKNTEVIENPYYNDHAVGAVPGFINKQNVNIMVSGGMGRRAQGFFEEFGIKTVTGFSQTVETAVEKYFEGKLEGFSPCSGGHSHEGHGNCH